MSHFTCLVIVDPPADAAKDVIDQVVKDALQPYHEYECPGVDDQYVVVDCHI